MSINISIEEFYKNQKIDVDFDYENYLLDCPEAIDFYQPYCKDNNIDDKHRLYFHYMQYGDQNFLYKKQKTSNNSSLIDTKTNIDTSTSISIIHIFPFEFTSLNDVNERQNFAILSYSQNRHKNTKLICFGNKNPSLKNIDFIPIESCVQSEDREYYLLNELISNVLQLAKPNDYIVYTNSDCYIKENFYSFILDNKYSYIEFFRQEVLNGVVVGHNKDGIDGFAANVSTLKKIQEKLENNALVIGSPYWDAIFSNVAREHIDNLYQDQHLLFHKKHTPRWSLKSLDIGGSTNLDTLNKLYEKGIIHCRKAEIKSDNLVIRLLDRNTNMSLVKENIVAEKFGKNKVTEFDYNYLLIETNNDGETPVLTDESIGTTSGTRYLTTKDQTQSIIEEQKRLYSRYVVLDENCRLDLTTKFSTNKKNTRLGVVLAVFGLDQYRVSAINKAIKELKKQSIWHDSKVVFVELLEDNQSSNFDFSTELNIQHLKIQSNKFNQNLFQKECLWNIGAKKIINDVDNIVFIDADTYSQDLGLFAKANKLLYKNPNIVYQLGDCIITIKDADTVTRVQWLWSDFSKLQAKNPYCFGPCGGFVISKQIFERMNGFNPYGFLYGGDILFLYEIDDRTHSVWKWAMDNMKIFHDMPRAIKHDDITVKNTKTPLIHCWHGNHVSRPYHVWGMVFNELNFNKQDIKVDHNGLLAWSGKQSFNKYFKFFANKHKIVSSTENKALYL